MIPIIHAQIHYHIKKHSTNKIVDENYVVEWISRIVYKKGGIPKDSIKKTVQDMCAMGLLKKKCRLKYEIVENRERPYREPLF